MQHEWGTALGMMLAKRGIGPGDLPARLRERGVVIVPEAMDDWLANAFVPGVRVWLRLGEALNLDPDEQAFLREGVCQDLPGEHEKLEQLCEAVRTGDLPLVAARLRTGVMIDRCGTSARVPIAEAVKAGRLEITRFLLEHGSDPNSREVGCETLLTLADKLGRGDLIRLLLDHGAYGGTDWGTGRSALHLLAQLPSEPGDDDRERVQRVMEEGASVNERCAGGPPPLIEAMRASNWRMCRILLERGATLHPGDGREFGDLLDAAKAADPTLVPRIDAIDPRPKGPFPRWFNEARCEGIERIEYINDRSLTFDINTTDPERPLLVGAGDGGGGGAMSPADFLADPSSVRQLETFGLGWLVPYLKKMADGTRFGINELLRGHTTVVRRRRPPRV